MDSRALAHIEADEGRLVSRNGNTFASFRDLAAQVARKFPRAVDYKVKRTRLHDQLTRPMARGSRH